MKDLMLALIWLGFFAAVFLAWFFYLKARNKERMALIDRDKDVSEIYAKREIRFRFPWLKLGIIITGVALGGVLIFSLSTIPQVAEMIMGTNGFLVFMTFMLFGGIGMIIAHYADKENQK